MILIQTGDNDVLSNAPKRTEEIEELMRQDACEKNSQLDEATHPQKITTPVVRPATGSINNADGWRASNSALLRGLGTVTLKQGFHT